MKQHSKTTALLFAFNAFPEMGERTSEGDSCGRCGAGGRVALPRQQERRLEWRR